MKSEHILGEINRILRKSHGEPAKLIEFIACIFDMNREEETASYPKIVRRLWPEEWQQAEDKVRFEQDRWNLLRMKRREINERVFQSQLNFSFFIELSKQKQFQILTSPEEIFHARLERLEWNLVRARSQDKRKSIKAQISELTDKFREFEKGKAGELPDAGGITEPGSENTAEDRQKPPPTRWKWATAGIAAVLVIFVTAVVIKNLFFRPVLPQEVLELPNEPSIAVLPFENISKDPELEYFCDGLTEGIITSLSKAPKMMVIASTSSFAYKGKVVNIQQIGKELNVRYILKGNAIKKGDKIRISAQLIDATSGNNLWAERYDRFFKDLFAVQDEIIFKILTELQVKLTGGETIRILAKGTDNLEAYQKFLQGYFSNWIGNPNDNVYAQQMFQEAIALDPEYAEAYAYLAYTHLADVRHGRGKSRQESVEQAFNLVQKALEKDESNAMGLHVLSAVYLFQGRYNEAIAKAEQAYDLAPNNYEVVLRLGLNLVQAGRPEEAIPYFKKTLSLNPLSPFFSLVVLGCAYSDMGKYDMAITFLEKAISIHPDSSLALLSLAACYAGVGREEEAHACVATALKIDPMITIKKLITGHPKRNKILLNKFAGLLRKAGLPD